MSHSMIFNVYKEKGLTSRQVVDRFKYNLPVRPRKIGHLGTLDPLAEGILLLATDSATKLADYVHEFLPKTYRAVGRFGFQTTTGDFWENAEIINQDLNLSEKLEKIHLRQTLEKDLKAKFEGDYDQIPPSVSATKFQGKALYKHAREGNFIIKDPVKRYIYNISINSLGNDELDFSVTVGSGTYIRTLFEDIAKYLGCFGALSSLKRVAIGNFTIENSLVNESWPNKDEINEFYYQQNGQALDQILDFPKIILHDSNLSFKYKNGIQIAQEFICDQLPTDKEICHHFKSLCWVYDHDSHLIGLGRLIDSALKVQFNLS